MSNIVPTVVSCPRCRGEQGARVFDSLSADVLPDQAALVADGLFERRPCQHCGAEFQPEHRMLYSHYGAGLWLVMHPRAERPRFAAIEPTIDSVFTRRFAEAPPAVANGLIGTRPRLVFGQAFLAEAVRCALAAIDPVTLECAKLLAVRDDLARFMAYGPFELCYHHTAESGALVHQVLALDTGDLLDRVELPPDALARARAMEPELTRSFPHLFMRPYISASRYLAQVSRPGTP